MSSSPQITYDPPEFSSLDLHTPTVEKMNGTFPAVVFPAGPQQHSNTKKSTSVAGSELRMRRCPASLGNGSRVLENQEIVLVSNVATVRKKPCGPRHVA